MKINMDYCIHWMAGEISDKTGLLEHLKMQRSSWWGSLTIKLNIIIGNKTKETMKEATEFGIKYLQVMPDGHQEFVMHKVVWRSRENAEKALELLRGVVACPVLVEIWDPAEIQALNEAADKPKNICPGDCPGTRKAEEPLPEPELEEDKEPGQPKENPASTNWTKKQITYTSHPDGTVTVTEDGKDVSDPEQRKKLQENLDHMFDDLLDQWPWLRDQSKKRKTDQELVQDRLPFPISPIWLWDPSQGPIFGVGGEHRPRFRSEVGSPAFKCEASD